MSRTLRALGMVLLLAVLAGCAAQRAYHSGDLAAKRKNWDRAVLDYSKALALDPGNSRYSAALERAKLQASNLHFTRGRRYAQAEQWNLAVEEFQQTLFLNPGNQHAVTELDRALRTLKRINQEPSRIEQLKAEARRKQLSPPKLNPKSNIPIVMMFPERPVGEIFEAISKASGVNFLYDEKVALDKPVDIDIGDVTLEKALDILMLQTKNFYKVIDENTILIAPDQRQARQEYEDQVIRTFFLSNGDTKQVVTLLRTLLNSRQIAENPDLNSVTIKDKPDIVAVAEKIINANDKSRGEIIVDVELLELNRTLAQTLGLDLTDKSMSLTFRGGNQAVPLNNLGILEQQGNWILGPIPGVLINFLKSDSETRSVAKPQIRVSEGEQAEILIGDRVPIPTTSFNTSQTIGGNIVPITSFTYQNVGITVQIEPRVHHNKEVTLKVQVEISQIASFVEGSGGQRQPIIGTRSIQTVIRLRDGETNILAGLIKRDDQDSLSGVPGLTDVPGLNRVFGNTSKSSTETDIVLTLTPHIIRIPDITEDDLATLWVGTQDNIQLQGPTRSALGISPFGTEVGADLADPSAAGAIGAAGEVPADDVEDEADRDRADPAAGDDEPDVGADDTTDEEDERPGDDEEPPTGPMLVRAVPSQAVYRVGDQVVVQVSIENGANVGSIPFHLRYNRDVLEFIPPGEEGGFLRSDGTGTFFLASDSVGGGELVVGLSRMGADLGATGSGSVVTFRFQAINPGDCGFAFISAKVLDPRARNLPAQFFAVPAQVQ